MTETERKSSDASGQEPANDGAEQSSVRGGDGGGGSLIDLAPALARLAAAAWWRTAERTVAESLRAGARLIGLAGEAVNEGRPASERGADRDDAADRRGSRGPSLRERGEELLRKSADVRYEEDAHPAYARILGELAPDEGRILRLLALEGAQPAVDIRAGLPLVSELVAPGRSMIGAEAGCRHVDDVHAYLNNLNRLGLIWFSREPVKESLRYQVLEAQPDVLAAMRKGGRTARTVRRSILLTPFGKDFCEMCLPVETSELEALPGEAPSAEDAPFGKDASAAGEPSPPDAPLAGDRHPKQQE